MSSPTSEFGSERSATPEIRKVGRPRKKDKFQKNSRKRSRTTSINSNSTESVASGTSTSEPQPRPAPATRNSLTQAKPTKTHLILKKLIDKNYLNHILSQNCDGLHIRSGVKKENLSEIHGNMYVERCSQCNFSPIYRIFDVTEKTNFRRHQTGRSCPGGEIKVENGHLKSPTQTRKTRSNSGRPCKKANSTAPKPGCKGQLLDTIIHFGEYSPENVIYPYNWLAAYKTIYPWWDGKENSWSKKINFEVQNAKEIKNKHSRFKQKLGCILCLGSSLTVLKSYKELWPKDFKNLIIVNLQYTPKDAVAKIKVHAKTDDFLERVYKNLYVMEMEEWETPEFLNEEERDNYFDCDDLDPYWSREF